MGWARHAIGLNLLPATDERLQLQPAEFLPFLHAALQDLHLLRLAGIGNSRLYTLLPICSIQAPFLQLHSQVPFQSVSLQKLS